MNWNVLCAVIMATILLSKIINGLTSTKTHQKQPQKLDGIDMDNKFFFFFLPWYIDCKLGKAFSL